MKTIKLLLTVLMLLAVGTTVACSTTSANSGDVSDSICKPLDQAGLKEVSVSQNRHKGIVTRGGQVASENRDKVGRSREEIADIQNLNDLSACSPEWCSGPSRSRTKA